MPCDCQQRQRYSNKSKTPHFHTASPRIQENGATLEELGRGIKIQIDMAESHSPHAQISICKRYRLDRNLSIQQKADQMKIWPDFPGLIAALRQYVSLISNNAPPRRTARQSPRRFPRAPCPPAPIGRASCRGRGQVPESARSSAS